MAKVTTNTMRESGLIHAYLLDGSGGARELTNSEMQDWQKDAGAIWLHFDLKESGVDEWLEKHSGVSELVLESLIAEETRPRVTTINHELLAAVRGVNLNPNADPEDMIAVRLWASDSKVITTLRRKVLSIDELADEIKQGNGPCTVSEFIVSLFDKLIYKIGGVIDSLEERLAELEEQSLHEGVSQLRNKLSDIRRETIILRRYLAPQREALVRLFSEKLSWFHEEDRFRLREVSDKLVRYVEELDSIRDRATVIHEELVSNASELINTRIYILSLVTAVFLPLSFLTGLFGINVGGIPGAESKLAFIVFILFLLVIGLIIFIYFKRKKWM